MSSITRYGLRVGTLDLCYRALELLQTVVAALAAAPRFSATGLAAAAAVTRLYAAGALIDRASDQVTDDATDISIYLTPWLGGDIDDLTHPASDQRKDSPQQ